MTRKGHYGEWGTGKWIFSEFQTPKWISMFVVLNHAWRILGKNKITKDDYLSLKACKHILEFSRQDEYTINRFNLSESYLSQLKSFSSRVFLCPQESRHAADCISFEPTEEEEAVRWAHQQKLEEWGGPEMTPSCEIAHITYSEERPHDPNPLI